MRERRVLAAAAYIAAASLVAMVWAASFRRSLNVTGADLPGPAQASAENAPSAAEFQKNSSTALKPETPLETLRSAVKAMAAGAKEINRAIGGLKKNLDLIAGAPPLTPDYSQNAGNGELDAGAGKEADRTEAKAAESSSAGRMIALAPGSQKEADDGREPSPAGILSADLAEKSYSASAIAKLSRPPLEFARVRIKKLKEQNRVVKIIYYNFGEMRKTAVDFYRYLVQ